MELVVVAAVGRLRKGRCDGLWRLRELCRHLGYLVAAQCGVASGRSIYVRLGREVSRASTAGIEAVDERGVTSDGEEDECFFGSYP